MKPIPFLLATFTGKLIQFLVWSLLLIWFGPTIMHTTKEAIHHHLNILLGVGGLGLLLLALWVVRRLFDRKKGMVLFDEDEA
jgi:membrane protein DedA with SNARE-associated domain